METGIKEIKEAYRALKDPLMRRFIIYPIILAFGITSAGFGLKFGLKSLEGTGWMQNFREKQKAKWEFLENFPSRITEETIYTPLGTNILGVDFEGDGTLDATIAYFAGTVRGMYGIDVRPVRNGPD